MYVMSRCRCRAAQVLVPIAAGSEPVEATVPIDVLRRAGAHVTIAATGGLLVHAMYGVKIGADATVADCADASYDLVALPGGIPGAANLGDCAALESIVRRHALKGRLYAAICAAPPLALARWGLLNGLKATAHPAFVDEFPAEVAAVDANVVVDGKVVTARGPAMAMEFALALVEQLYGKDKVDQIAKPMLVRYEPGYTFKELNPIQWQCNGTPKVLIPLANANEEMEVITIIDALRRANAAVVVASAEDGVEIVARHNTRIVADVLLDAAADQQFDLIIVPGGMPGAKTLAGQEGDDGHVHGVPAGGRRRVREQGARRREPDHEQGPRDGHGVRGGRRGEADGERGGAGGGGRLALRLSRVP
ncbi:hypothetical protein PVAP13_5KG027800 [Panicum virgatum]|uniref:DJ-1/PfpI domain-containing protein n=1 Tax=Panicum virgatum TaxID=38727 RepID=A0A8T0S9F5_PANVG|nr:hypothetical protein PVAP13_5KG027800 [Panicum virgatum]